MLLIKLINFKRQSLYKKSLLCVTSFVLGYALYKYKVLPYLGLDKAIIAFGFVSLGTIASELNINLTNRNNIIIGIISTILWVAFGVVLNVKCSMYSMSLGVYPYFVLSGISGTITFCLMCRQLERFECLRLLAPYTVFVVASHYFFVSLFNVVAERLGWMGTEWFNIPSLLYVMVVLAAYVPVSRCVAKYMPLLNGQVK